MAGYSDPPFADRLLWSESESIKNKNLAFIDRLLWSESIKKEKKKSFLFIDRVLWTESAENPPPLYWLPIVNTPALLLILEYCNTSFWDLSAEQIDKLQKTRNAAVRGRVVIRRKVKPLEIRHAGPGVSALAAT